MSKNDIILNLFESHLQRERKEHKKSLKEINRKLNQVKDMKNNNYSELNGIESKQSKLVSFVSDTKTIVNQTSSIDLSEYLIPSDLHLVNAVQYFQTVENEESKFETVFELFKNQGIDSAVIYCNTCEKVDLLTQFMATKGMNAKSFNKIKTKKKEKIIEQFLSEVKPIQAIIAVKRIANLRDVSLYINFDLPSRKTYIKKIGSIGIDGPKYVVINIVNKSDSKNLGNYEKFYGTKINPLPFRSENLL